MYGDCGDCGDAGVVVVVVVDMPLGGVTIGMGMGVGVGGEAAASVSEAAERLVRLVGVLRFGSGVAAAGDAGVVEGDSEIGTGVALAAD